MTTPTKGNSMFYLAVIAFAVSGCYLALRGAVAAGNAFDKMDRDSL